MTSFYGRLFHAGSAERERLEDFLTEILADLLNRLPERAKRHFCERFLLRDSDPSDRRAWLDRASQPGNLVWKSQAWIAIAGMQKRPDLILYHRRSEFAHVPSPGRHRASYRETPILIVECKVSAKFGSDQLASYDKWLVQNGGSLVALVVITHSTEAPVDFRYKGRESYKARITTIRRWSELYSWLSDDLDQAFPEKDLPPECALLRSELVEFLREERLMTDEPTFQDVAAARLYLNSGAHMRFVGFMTSIRNAVREKFGNLKGWPDKPPQLWSEPSYEYGGVADWCVLHRGIQVGWGLYLGDAFWPEHMEPPVPTVDGGAVWLEFKDKAVRPSTGDFSAWHFPVAAAADEFFVGKIVDLHNFREQPTAQFSLWVVSALEESREIIDAVLAGSC